MKKKQSLSGYIRANLTQIEAKMHDGFSQESIVGELQELGYLVTVPNFRNLLYRARQRRDEERIKKTVPTEEKKSAPKPQKKQEPDQGFIFNSTPKEDDLI